MRGMADEVVELLGIVPTDIPGGDLTFARGDLDARSGPGRTASTGRSSQAEAAAVPGRRREPPCGCSAPMAGDDASASW
jgi:hypothetical protein